MPTSDIEAVKPGLVELRGRIVPRDGLLSPIVNRPCLGWQVSISQAARFNPGNSISYSSIWQQSHFEFYLEDDTGRILVVLDDASDFNDLQEVQWRTGSYSEHWNQFRGAVLRDDLTLWGKQDYYIKRLEAPEFSPEAIELAQRHGHDLHGGARPRLISVTVYEAIKDSSSPNASKIADYISPDGLYCMIGTVVPRPATVAGASQRGDYVIRRDPENRILVLSPRSARFTAASMLLKSILQFFGVVFCVVMACGVFAPHAIVKIAGFCAALCFVSILVCSGLTKGRVSPGIICVFFAIFFLAGLAFFMFGNAAGLDIKMTVGPAD